MDPLIVKKVQKELLGVLVILYRWDHLVRLVRRTDLVEIVIDERPCVHLRIEIGVYGVRGIPGASIIRYPSCEMSENQVDKRLTFPPK